MSKIIPKISNIFKNHGLEKFIENKADFLNLFESDHNISIKTFDRDFVYKLYEVYNDFIPLLHLNPLEAHIEFLERVRLLLIDINKDIIKS